MMKFRQGGTRAPEINHLSGIYAFTCMPDGKMYIGSAKRLRIRFVQHVKALRAQTHGNSRFQREWNKRGEAAFSFSVLLVCAPEDLLFYEQRAFDVFDPALNVVRVAGSSLGRKYTPEAYARIVAALRKTNQRPEVRAQRSADRKGIPLSPETRAKISAALKGRRRPPEVVAKIRAGHAARIQAVGQRPPMSLITRSKIAAALRGRPKSPEVRAKLAAAQKGRRKPRRNLNQLRMEFSHGGASS